MKRLLHKVKPEFVWRLGLGAMYLYSGWDIFTHPEDWTWVLRALPEALSTSLLAVSGPFLKTQALAEIFFGGVFLLWFLPVRLVKWVSLLSALQLAAIILLVGIDPVTFRDLGLLGGSLGLFFFYRRAQFKLI
ncbi:MAG: hypothetical protein AAB589_01140 [Patescibacteria group bacterium]